MTDQSITVTLPYHLLEKICTAVFAAELDAEVELRIAMRKLEEDPASCSTQYDVEHWEKRFSLLREITRPVSDLVCEAQAQIRRDGYLFAEEFQRVAF